jgi:hypothetical protein
MALQEDPDYFKKRQLNENFAKQYASMGYDKIKFGDIFTTNLTQLGRGAKNAEKAQTFEDGISFIKA